MAMKKRGRAAAQAAGGPVDDGGFGRALQDESAKAKAPLPKESSLRTKAQVNLLCGWATAPGRSITHTKMKNVIATRAAARRAWTRTAILSPAQRNPRPTA